MKNCMLILFAAVLTGCSSAAKTATENMPEATYADVEKEMEWKQEAKNILPERVLDSILTNRTFDFVARRGVNLYGSNPKVSQYADKRSIRRIYPREYYNSKSRASDGDPISLAVSRTTEGWTVVWSERQYGCGGAPGYTYTCEAIFRNELTVAKDGSATLKRSTAALDHKYPTIRNGYIAEIPDWNNKWLGIRDHIAK